MAKWGEIKCPRCEELEAKLAKAVGLIDDVFSDHVENCGCEVCQSYLERRAELTGGNDA